ncbi:MAG: HEAT repeat domain-containing protein [Candidatus Freyarchaeota archaeon]|nr:HEAT repeat domain-containing protein [Candidatus Jordarchaeia archaeon]MBS7269146.1 HEAT repeat domain-containing protein [Candidatus Jordarchaeia archaeon]MBS7280243.1 HEAT repeat domain-containing protein [Candidatus Jordarchaeia archaeon]
MGEAEFYKRDLKRMEQQKDVKGLIDTLNHASNWEIRALAAEALGRIGGGKAEEALRKAQNDDKDLLVRIRAEEALEKITGIKGESAKQTIETDWRALLKSSAPSKTNRKSVYGNIDTSIK